MARKRQLVGQTTSGDSYIKMKIEEWNSFTKHLTEWERQNTLDC